MYKEKITIWQWLFIWLLLDSLILYMVRRYFFFPINSMLPFLVVIAHFIDQRKNAIPIWLIGAMSMVGIGLLLGTLSGDPLWRNTKTFVTAVCGFIIGYRAVLTANDLRPFINLLGWIGLIYTMVCLLAISGVNNTFFPVSYLEGYDDGVLVRRAEITTDQNHQIYYLFPLLMVFSLKQPLLKAIGFTFFALGAIYVAIKMESRSGLLLLIVGLAMFTLLPAWYKEKRSLWRVVGVGVVGMIAVVFNLSLLQDSTDVVSRRFDSDNLVTLWARIYSALFLYERIWNPLWWFPRGLSTFFNEQGVFPHHAPTFIFLQAGLLGLVGWFILIGWPLFKSFKYILTRKFCITEATIMAGSLISFVASLSLAVAMFEQVWLWGGAAHGVLMHYRRRVYRQKQHYRNKP